MEDAFETCETCEGQKWIGDEEIECPECHARGIVPSYNASKFQRGLIFSTLNQY